MRAAAIVEKENNDHDGDKKVKWFYRILFFCAFVFHNMSLSMIDLRHYRRSGIWVMCYSGLTVILATVREG
jgi:cell division protein FtsW (lipid II flippase)